LYIREGDYADLVLLDLNNKWQATPGNLQYKCKWSPFDGYQFKSKVMQTFINGNLVYKNGTFKKTIFHMASLPRMLI
jgi:dihydroorotase